MFSFGNFMNLEDPLDSIQTHLKDLSTASFAQTLNVGLLSPFLNQMNG